MRSLLRSLFRPVLEALALLARAVDPAESRIRDLPERLLADVGITREQIG